MYDVVYVQRVKIIITRKTITVHFDLRLYCSMKLGFDTKCWSLLLLYLAMRYYVNSRHYCLFLCLSIVPRVYPPFTILLWQTHLPHVCIHPHYLVVLMISLSFLPENAILLSFSLSLSLSFNFLNVIYVPST